MRQTLEVMIPTRLIVLLPVAILILSCTGLSHSVPSDDTHNRMPTQDSLIQRIVCFKFKAHVTKAQVEQHMKGFAGLKDSISQMLSYRAGTTVKGDLDENAEYDVMHYSTYRTEEDIRKYSIHPVHLRFIEQNKETWAKVLVINSTFLPH